MHFFARCVTAFAAVAVTCAAAQAASSELQTADLIVLNANVVTMDEGNPQAGAFAVKDGTFVAVGSAADMAGHRGEGTRVIDAKGYTVIPGLNDSHTHVIREGRLYNLELRWDGVDSLERGLAMIREQAKRTPKGQWVSVVGG